MINYQYQILIRLKMIANIRKIINLYKYIIYYSIKNKFDKIQCRKIDKLIFK